MIGFIAGLFVGAFLGTVAMAVVAYRKHVALEAEIERAEEAADLMSMERDTEWEARYNLLRRIERVIEGSTRVRTSRILEALDND